MDQRINQLLFADQIFRKDLSKNQKNNNTFLKNLKVQNKKFTILQTIANFISDYSKYTSDFGYYVQIIKSDEDNEHYINQSKNYIRDHGKNYTDHEIRLIIRNNRYDFPDTLNEIYCDIIERFIHNRDNYDIYMSASEIADNPNINFNNYKYISKMFWLIRLPNIDDDDSQILSYDFRKHFAKYLYKQFCNILDTYITLLFDDMEAIDAINKIYGLLLDQDFEIILQINSYHGIQHQIHNKLSKLFPANYPFNKTLYYKCVQYYGWSPYIINAPEGNFVKLFINMYLLYNYIGNDDFENYCESINQCMLTSYGTINVDVVSYLAINDGIYKTFRDHDDAEEKINKYYSVYYEKLEFPANIIIELKIFKDRNQKRIEKGEPLEYKFLEQLYKWLVEYFDPEGEKIPELLEFNPVVVAPVVVANIRRNVPVIEERDHNNVN